ncbi:peptidoglycan-binding protein [Micromonospora sp. GCM10011541]|uniref:peptidoglycan-binding domain-containing protein n=1 Tax=Micromonospora TaxID=1873 RepID=UPI003607D106
MLRVRFVARVVALGAVLLVGVGACALDPQGDGSGAAAPAPVGLTERASGASATPAPDPTTGRPTPQPSRTTTPKPSRTAKPSATPKPSSSGFTGCPQGDRQRDVETYLARLGGFGKLTVDGKQSAADCAAIKRFQRRYGISPAEGRAGPTTYDVARRLATTDVRRCRAGSGLPSAST